MRSRCEFQAGGRGVQVLRQFMEFRRVNQSPASRRRLFRRVQENGELHQGRVTHQHPAPSGLSGCRGERRRVTREREVVRKTPQPVRPRSSSPRRARCHGAIHRDRRPGLDPPSVPKQCLATLPRQVFIVDGCASPFAEVLDLILLVDLAQPPMRACTASF